MNIVYFTTTTNNNSNNIKNENTKCVNDISDIILNNIKCTQDQLRFQNNNEIVKETTSIFNSNDETPATRIWYFVYDNYGITSMT